MSQHQSPASQPFIGRESELDRINDLLVLPACRLLTLTGPGGIGKTRLAMEAAIDQQRHFAHGVHLVSLTSINSAELVPSAIANTLQVALYSAADPHDQIIHYLRDKHLLLILDNFEHVLEATELLTELLQSAPGVKCLVTSRERLNLREEWTLTLDGLPYPKDNKTDEPFERYGAVQLFAQRARQVQANFTLEQHIEAVKTICQLVEGMPLALELAATWLRAMSCRQIAAQLGDNPDFLTTPLRDVPERHRSMRGVFEESWRLLSPVEQRVMMYLSAFRGGFDREAAEAVAGASLPVLAALADKSMIRLNAAERYDLHELLRQYAAEKLSAAGETQTAHQRHCDYFLKLAEAAGDHAFGREQIMWFDRLEIELDNLRMAMSWSLNRETSLRISVAMRWFFSERGHWSEGVAWLERVLAANPNADKSLRACALYSLAALSNDEQQAQAWCDKAFALAHAAGDRLNMAWALSHKAIYGTSDQSHSVELLNASLTLFREIDDAMGIAHTLVRRSWYAWSQADYAYAHLLLGEAGMIAQEAGDKILMGWVIHGLGIIARRQGELEQARLQFAKGLMYFREAHFTIGCDVMLLGSAVVAQELGNIEQARTFYRDALLSMRGTYRSDHYLFPVLHGLAWLAWISEQSEQANLLLHVLNNPGFDPEAKPGEMTPLQGEMTALRDYFGADLFDGMMNAGQDMTIEQAITFLEEGARQVAIPAAGQPDRMDRARPSSPNRSLTKREAVILRLLAEGLNSREIAERLVVSVGTVRWYLKHIYRKLDAHSRSEAIARARALKLLT